MEQVLRPISRTSSYKCVNPLNMQPPAGAEWPRSPTLMATTMQAAIQVMSTKPVPSQTLQEPPRQAQVMEFWGIVPPVYCVSLKCMHPCGVRPKMGARRHTCPRLSASNNDRLPVGRLVAQGSLHHRFLRHVDDFDCINRSPVCLSATLPLPQTQSLPTVPTDETSNS